MAASYRRESFILRKFLLSLVIGAVFLFNTLSVTAEGLSTKAAFDTSALNTGIVGISYVSDVEKIKVFIDKNGKRYTYNLNNDGIEEDFSLQMGNGEYKISVLENIGGTSYKYISTEIMTLNLSDANGVYLTSVQNINWNDENIAIKKAKELTKNLANDEDKLNAIYNYIVSNFKYDYSKLNNLKSDYLPDIDLTLNSNTGICYDYASTFAAMLRSAGIPAKLVKGYSTNVDGYHAWNEVYNKETKSWIIIDTTYDSQMMAGKVKYSMEKENGQYTKVYEY